jgi:hypothetical protein
MCSIKFYWLHVFLDLPLRVFWNKVKTSCNKASLCFRLLWTRLYTCLHIIGWHCTDDMLLLIKIFYMSGIDNLPVLASFCPPSYLYCHVSGVPWLIITGTGLDDWIYFTLYIRTVRNYRQYSAIAILHTSQFTAAHALGFSVFTSRILATDLSQSHCNFKSHVKSSRLRLIPFLRFLQLQIPRLLSTTVLYFSVLRLLLLLLSCRTLLLTTSHGHHGNTVCIIDEACLPCRCLATGVLLLHTRMLRKCVYRSVA